MKTTPKPWQQGRLLMTAQTRKWDLSARSQGENYESKRVFSNFSDLDQGRSRVLVAQCQESEDAELIVRAVNNHDELVAALEQAQVEIVSTPHSYKDETTRRILAQIKAALKKAKL